MTYLADLTTTRDNLASALATESANPKPSYSVDGRSFAWNDYFRMQMQAIKDLTELINNLSPYIITTRQVV